MRVLVTGVSKGLGLAIANAAAAEGHDVAGIGRSERPTTLEGGCSYEIVDGTEAEAAAVWVERELKGTDGRVGLINNAGSYHSSSFENVTATVLLEQFEANVVTAFNVTKAVLACASEVNIVNVVSRSALEPTSTNAAYGSTKAAMMHMFQSLQTEVSSDRIRISNIYPGSINTWSTEVEPETINPADIARFVVDLAAADRTFYVKECYVLPIGL